MKMLKYIKVVIEIQKECFIIVIVAMVISASVCKILHHKTLSENQLKKKIVLNPCPLLNRKA